MNAAEARDINVAGTIRADAAVSVVLVPQGKRITNEVIDGGPGSSGVEASKGVKDAGLIHQFVAAVRAADVLLARSTHALLSST